MANATVWSAGSIFMAVALTALIMSAINTSDRDKFKEDRASEVIFHMETHPGVDSTYSCDEVARKMYFDAAWHRMPQTTDVTRHTDTTVYEFNITHRGIYTVDVHLYEDTQTAHADGAGTGFAEFYLTGTGIVGAHEVDLAWSTWQLRRPNETNIAGYTNLHVTRLLPAGTVLFLKAQCASPTITTAQGSFTIFKETLPYSSYLPTVTPAPTPAPTPE
jgi:hypothetical protein